MTTLSMWGYSKEIKRLKRKLKQKEITEVERERLSKKLEETEGVIKAFRDSFGKNGPKESEKANG